MSKFMGSVEEATATAQAAVVQGKQKLSEKLKNLSRQEIEIIKNSTPAERKKFFGKLILEHALKVLIF